VLSRLYQEHVHKCILCCCGMYVCAVRATGLLCLLGISVGLGSIFIYRLYTKLFSSTDAKHRRHVSDLGSSVKSSNGIGNLPGTLEVSAAFSVHFVWIVTFVLMLVLISLSFLCASMRFYLCSHMSALSACCTLCCQQIKNSIMEILHSIFVVSRRASKCFFNLYQIYHSIIAKMIALGMLA